MITEQKIRDLRDETRKTGKLTRAIDAVEVRVDKISLDEVVDQIEVLARAAMETNAECGVRNAEFEGRNKKERSE